MPSNGKNKGAAALLFFLILTSCTNNTAEHATSANDSISRVSSQRKLDSLKKRNPFIPMPPDSDYTGTYIDKYDNGVIKFRGFYRFGERHGQWLSFYPDGKAWSELHFDKGLRHGPNITYYQNGQIRYTGAYKNDKRDSIWEYYDSTGRVAERVLFSNDRLVKKTAPGGR